MKKTLLTLATICLASAQVLFAQSRTIRGTVLDENGEPIYYATISVTHNGKEVSVQTDESGNYELVVPDGAENFTVSYIGYNTQTKKITEENTSTQMTYGVAKSADQLEDVNISAPYQGSLSKLKFVGAGDRIGSEKIGKMPISNFTKALEANAPGVMVTNGGGQPGSNAAIRIRGFSSINGSNDPLIVLDGAPYMGSYSSINPNDIESMDVLKDATATSLYGSRGANGVILITTKSGGKNKKGSINVESQVGVVQRAIPNYDIITDPKEYYEFAFDAYRNKLVSGGLSDEVARKIAAGLDPNGESLVAALGGYNSYDVPDDQLLDENGKLNPNAKLKYNDLWDKEMQRTGIRQNYNVSAAGGSQTSDYYISIGYLNEKSYMKHSDFERFTGRTNLKVQVNDWLKFGLNVSGNYSTSNFLSSGSTAPGANPFYASRSFAPIYPVYYYNADGEREIDPYTGKYKYDWGAINIQPSSSIGTRTNGPNMNVIGSMDLDHDRTRMANITAIPSIEAKFLKNFTFRTLFSTSYYNSNGSGYTNPLYGQGQQYNGSVTKNNVNQLDYTFNQVLTWNKQINQVHGLDFLVAHEAYSLTQYQLSVSRRGVPNINIPDLTGTPTSVGADSRTDADRMESFIGQVNYNYKGKYFATANARRDGSSRFHPDHRWGTFWSIGGGWILSQESFIKDNITWLSNLKFKTSYGTQGSNGASFYPYKNLASIDYANGTNPGALITSMGTEDLTWESQKSFNAGLEFAIRNSVRGEINYFNRTGADQLYFMPLAPSTGVSGVWKNLMSTNNQGVEVALYFNVINSPKSKFTWLMDVNATHFKNKITKMARGENDSLITGNFMYKKGASYYDYYMVRSAGVDPATGQEMYYGKTEDGRDSLMSKQADAANSGGRSYVGSAIPTLQGGFNNSFGYKGFDLNIGISFSLGGLYYDGAYQALMGSSLRAGTNVHRDWLEDRWTVENKSGSLPRAQFDDLDVAGTSDRFLISRSYLNLRNVNLGYTFSPSVLRTAKIQSLRVYLAADNLWLFTKRQGMDPQVNFAGGTSTGGSAYGFTAARTLIFGVNIGL